MFLRRFHKLQSSGDTIVEVMIVLAILGLSIGICYATANRSLLNARQAQESARAALIAQSQIESLRSNTGRAPNDPNYVYRKTNQPFCMATNGDVADYFISPVNVNPACLYDADLYNVKVTHTTGSKNPNFKVEITWEDVRGLGQDSLNLSYRVYR